MSSQDVSMLNESMNDLSVSFMHASNDDSVRSIDMEMLLDTLEDSVGSGITTKTHRALRQNSEEGSMNQGTESSLNNMSSFSLNPVENDAMEYFDELFGSNEGSGSFKLTEQQSSLKSVDVQPEAPIFAQPFVPPQPPSSHIKQGESPQRVRTPSLSSNDLPKAAQPPARTTTTDTTNMLVCQDAADKVFAQEMPSTAAEYSSVSGVTVLFLNAFYDRYWRNKRHNVQCFPKDGIYGDYCNWLMASKESKGDLSTQQPVCVRVERTNEASHSYDQVQCIARIIPLTQRRQICTPGNALPENFAGLSSFDKDGGYSRGIRSTEDPSLYNIAPKLWKYGGELPKKRRQGTDYRLCLEVLILGHPTSTSGSGGSGGSSTNDTLVCLACCASPAFELGSTRTLMRLKVKYKESLRGPGEVSARNPPTKRTKSTAKEDVATKEMEDMEVQVQDQQQNDDKRRKVPIVTSIHSF